MVLLRAVTRKESLIYLIISFITLLKVSPLSLNSLLKNDCDFLQKVETYRISNFSDSHLHSPHLRRQFIHEPNLHVSVKVSSNSSSGFPPSPGISRLNPLNNFQPYLGGFNLTDTDYWASLIFVGVWSYSLALIFCFIGLITIFYLLFGTSGSISFSNDLKNEPKSKSSESIQKFKMVLIVVIVSMVIIGSSLIFSYCFLIDKKLEKTMDVVSSAAEEARNDANNVSIAINEVAHSFKDNNVINESTKLQMESISLDLIDSSSDISKTVEASRPRISRTINLIQNLTQISSVLNILTLISLILLSSLYRCLRLSSFLCYLFTIVITFWITLLLVTLLSGLFFVADNFLHDACFAMDEYVSYPESDKLDEIFPCKRLRPAQQHLYQIRDEVIAFVNAINDLNNTNYGNGSSGILVRAVLISYNVTRVCNPFEERSLNCTDLDTFFSLYKEALSVAAQHSTNNSSQSIAIMEATLSFVHSYSKAEKLVDCYYIHNTLNVLTESYCEPVRKRTKALWLILVIMFCLDTISIIVYLIETMAYLRQQKVEDRIESEFDLDQKSQTVT